MKILLVRHGMTKGNKQHRYVGSTDEELISEGKEELLQRAKALREERFLWEDQEANRMKEPEHIFVSPMLRCRQSGEILFPKSRQIEIPELRECNFGEFEYLNYQDLDGNIDFQRFIDSGGKAGFPGGEDLASFQNRCIEGFEKVMEQHQKEGKEELLVLVVHGGTIMSLLDCYSSPHKSYYDWQVKNGEGYAAETEGSIEQDEFAFRNIRKV